MSTAIEAGQTIGKYRIDAHLGSGGMADVFAAEDLVLGRTVALKVLPPEYSRNESFLQRFEKEVRAAARLNHRSIVTVFDVGHEPPFHYFSMRLLPGGDLRRRIGDGMTPDAALSITLAVAEAFVHAHENGFVHRDVKPENILFDEDGNPVLTDFGIAKAVASDTRMTATGVALGTPRYTSPEQARGRPVDGRADLYSLGVILHEMLTGEPPFDGNEPLAVIFKHVTEPVPTLPESAALLQPLVNDLMAKEPDDRIPDARALITRIEELLTQHPELVVFDPRATWPGARAARLLTPAPANDTPPPDPVAPGEASAAPTTMNPAAGSVAATADDNEKLARQQAAKEKAQRKAEARQQAARNKAEADEKRKLAREEKRRRELEQKAEAKRLKAEAAAAKQQEAKARREAAQAEKAERARIAKANSEAADQKRAERAQQRAEEKAAAQKIKEQQRLEQAAARQQAREERRQANAETWRRRRAALAAFGHWLLSPAVARGAVIVGTAGVLVGIGSVYGPGWVAMLSKPASEPLAPRATTAPASTPAPVRDQALSVPPQREDSRLPTTGSAPPQSSDSRPAAAIQVPSEPAETRARTDSPEQSAPATASPRAVTSLSRPSPRPESRRSAPVRPAPARPRPQPTTRAIVTAPRPTAATPQEPARAAFIRPAASPTPARPRSLPPVNAPAARPTPSLPQLEAADLATEQAVSPPEINSEPTPEEEEDEVPNFPFGF